MHLDVTSLIFWKTEHTEEDNEDALASDRTRGLFTVADGVGEASFSYQWAPVLVKRFVEEPLFSSDPFEVEHWVRAAQGVGQQVMISPDALEGIARTKARLGAAATLVGLGIVPRNGSASATAHATHSYKVAAVGDSNFFHWRGDPVGGYALLRAFPIQSSRDFGTLPDSINSRTFDRDNTNVQLFDASTDTGNDLQDNDVLMLATDAVAQWILRTIEAGGDPMPHLLQQSETTWPGFILALRQDKQIVNDDSTLLLISVTGVTEGEPLSGLPDQKTKRTEELWTLMKAYAHGEARDVELALAYGDGTHIEPGTRAFVEPLVARWRERADAYKRVSDTINIFLRHPEQRGQLEKAWSDTRDLLAGLHWTQELIATLRTLGVDEQPQNIPGGDDSLTHELHEPDEPVAGDSESTVADGADAVRHEGSPSPTAVVMSAPPPSAPDDDRIAAPYSLAPELTSSSPPASTLPVTSETGASPRESYEHAQVHLPPSEDRTVRKKGLMGNLRSLLGGSE